MFRQCSPSGAELSGVQNWGSSVTIGGSGVPAGQPTGQSSPGPPRAGGLALRRGRVPVRKALPPLREVQFPQRSVGTFLIIVITTISRGADNPVWALCFKPSSTASLEPGAGGTWAEVLSPILQMWPLRSVGFQILLPRHQLGCGGWERVLGFQRLTLEVQGGGIISWGGGVATFQVWGGFPEVTCTG